MSRVPTYISGQVQISQMLDIQSRLNDSQTQVNTEKKSQDYAGIATDSFRLISFENQSSRIERYSANNGVAKIRLDTMQNSVNSSQASLQEYKALLLDFAARDYNDMSQEDTKALDSIRAQSFTAMKDLQYYLNTSVDGRYLFSGGKTDVPPVEMPWGNVDEFADVYDGTNTVFPETRAANLADVDFSARTVDMTNQTVGGTSYGTIEDTSGVAADTFITGSPLTSDSFGKLLINPTIPSDSTKGSIVSDQPNAFSGLSVGMTFFLDDDNAVENTGGTAVTDRQSGIYTITDISSDGKTMTIVPPPAGTGGTTAQIPSTAGAEIRLTAPEGARISVKNSAGQNEDYTIHWPTNADLTAAGYDLTTDLIDGKKLFVSPPFAPSSTGYGTTQTNVTVSASSYYQGDTLQLTHRVDDTRTVTLGINALDPAFEKAFRGLGIMAQGVKMDSSDPTKVDAAEMRRRVDTALDLVNDALQHSTSSSEEPSDLVGLGYRLGSNQKILQNSIDEAASFQAFLDNRVTDMENVNMLDAVTRMNDDAQALEVSYSAMSKISKLSLLNYL